MRNIVFGAAVALASTSVFAVDSVGTVTVSLNGTPVFASSTSHFGMSQAEATQLQSSAVAALDVAARAQDKGGPYSIKWEWSTDGKAQPALETGGMTLDAVNRTMRRSHVWLSDRIGVSEARHKQGKGRPWGKDRD